MNRQARNRRPAAAKRVARRKLWSFVNSAIFLWFLSAVVVSGLTSYVTRRERLAARTADEAVRNTKLIHEFANRWRRFHYYTTGVALLDSQTHAVSNTRAFLFASPRTTEIGYIFPEFADNSLTSILLELELMTDLNEHTERLRRLRDHLDGLAMTLETGREGIFVQEQLQRFSSEWRDVLDMLGYAGFRDILDPVDSLNTQAGSSASRPR
jgi:hypothetical protein